MDARRYHGCYLNTFKKEKKMQKWHFLPLCGQAASFPSLSGLKIAHMTHYILFIFVLAKSYNKSSS